MLPPVDTALAVHVLIHRHEQRKPSSTGAVIARAVAGTTSHIFQRASRFFPASGWPAATVAFSESLWILHPSGEPLPAFTGQPLPASGLRAHILLLDGTWRQAGEMLRSLEGVGRCVRLADAADGPSRYWLRDQPGESQVSTAEALMGVFRAVGEPEAERRLRLHFELHVYATRRARGNREMAERYLGHSPLLAEAAEAIERLHARP
jgi:DTW domain-containing protein YfiP